MCNLMGMPTIRPKGHIVSFLFVVIMVGDALKSIVHRAYRTLLILSREPEKQRVKASSPSYRVH